MKYQRAAPNEDAPNRRRRRFFLRPSVVLCANAHLKLIPGLPYDPNTLGPTQTFLKTFWDIKVYFRLFLRIFILFPCKKVCLPTDPKIFGHVTGNKAYFSFGLSE